MASIVIYGVEIPLPEPPEKIEDWGIDNPEEQFWRKPELPSFFDKVEYDKEGAVLLTPQQEAYAIQEVDRCINGFWFYNNGEPTYIAGKHYFYLTYWRLEDDIHPEYRDTDRRYFLYLNHWEKQKWCLGVIRGKKRREGASSQATANLVYECIFYKNSFCGLVSKTEKDSKTTFTNMVAFGYRQLPVFLKPKQLNNKDSVSELIFAHKSSSIKDGVGSVMDNDTGHRSKVDYRAPAINAYDSGRMSRILVDEGGKWPKDVPFSKYIAIVSKTLVKGAKRVGFMEVPSTVNEMTKAGGDEFKKAWDNADNFKHERTPNRLVRYFSPAYDGYVGFIDKYGMSVIDEPNPQQYKYLVETQVGIGDLTEADIKVGSKQYLINKRAMLEGEDLEEEIRMNPFDEREMFMSADTDSLFPAMMIREQEDWLQFNHMTERGNLVWDNGDDFYTEYVHPDGYREPIPNKLIWVPNDNGRYEKVIGWEPVAKNDVVMRNGFFFPASPDTVSIGGDPFKYDKTKDVRKSNTAVYAYQDYDYSQPNDPFNDCFTMAYVYRANTAAQQYDDALKMAWYCGGKILWERNVDGWIEHFRQRKCSGFLQWLAGEVMPGVYADGSGNVIHSLVSLHEAYILKHVKKIYFKSLLSVESGYLGFSVKDTEKFDDVMGAGYALMANKAKRKAIVNKTVKNVESILPLHKAS